MQPNPCRIASAALAPFLRAADADSVPGDLLEEYRDVKLPALGARRANHWYRRQVLGTIWRVMWPCFLAVSALRVLFFPLPGGWNPSLVPAPGVSALDAVLFVAIGFYGSRRTGRLATGIIMSGLTAIVGAAFFFVYAAIGTPSLLAAPFDKPFIFVIIATVFAIAEAFAIVAGALGAATARWLGPTSERIRAS